MDNSIFLDISIILGIAIAIAFVVQLLRQPLIISYILTGIIAGPMVLNLVNKSWAFFEVFSEFGVILLLFLVGLSLNVNYLKKIGKVAAITGIGQVVFTSFFGYFLLLFMGFGKVSAIYLAIAITFSSTIIIIKFLADKREAGTVYGRYTIGLMLVQDMIAITIMIVLPAIQSGTSIALAMTMILVKCVVLFVSVIFLSKFLLPFVIDRIAQSPEFLLIFTLAWCFAIAGFGEWAGVSLEVGAIIAGLSLGSSVYSTEISSRIKPLRDFFIALFFIILGSQMSLGNFSVTFWPGLVLSLFVLIGNPLILYALYRFSKFTRKSSFMAALTAAQVSEFGFVFLFVAMRGGGIDENIISIFTIVALITIFVSSYLITYNHQIYKYFLPWFHLFGADKHKNKNESEDIFDVIVFGYHRLGWKICEALAEMKVSFAVVDFNPAALKKLQDRNIPHFFGDATEIDFLCDLPIDRAKMIISTMPQADDQMALIKHIRLINEKAIVIANLAHMQFLEELYKVGADYIMMPHLLSGMWLADVLKDHNWSREKFKKLTEAQKIELQLRFTMGEGK